MARPTFLVVEPEPGHALSSRKLVLESAKYNVLTAHSWAEATELFKRFPRLDAVIVTSEVDEGVPCDDFVGELKRQTPELPVIVLSPGTNRRCGTAEYNICSHEPHSLLDLLRSLFGDPRPGSGHDAP